MSWEIEIKCQRDTPQLEIDDNIRLINMLYVSNGRSVTLIRVCSGISHHVHLVNASNSILPIILVGYPGLPPLNERTGCQCTFLISYQNQQHGVIGSMNPSGLVISSSTLRQISSSMSSLCFTCPLTAHRHSRWRFTSWSRACCVGTISDWLVHLLPHCLSDDWQVPSPNRGPAATNFLSLSDSPHGVTLPADDSGHDIISFSQSNSCSSFLVLIKSGVWFRTRCK